jgi:hypothetical protein
VQQLSVRHFISNFRRLDNAAITDYFKTNPTPETNPLLIKEEQPKR